MLRDVPGLRFPGRERQRYTAVRRRIEAVGRREVLPAQHPRVRHEVPQQRVTEVRADLLPGPDMGRRLPQSAGVEQPVLVLPHQDPNGVRGPRGGQLEHGHPRDPGPALAQFALLVGGGLVGELRVHGVVELDQPAPVAVVREQVAALEDLAPAEVVSHIRTVCLRGATRAARTSTGSRPAGIIAWSRTRRPTGWGFGARGRPRPLMHLLVE
ncbi:hypothetical protein [Streptomyces sp. NPDC059994]|uniref:hypothetical protein n=1 Tax=Streptomyces sp. NPDC059994 TaxID=3347029 RepID=UPI00367894E9